MGAALIGKDSIHFGSSAGPLALKYGIDPDQVTYVKSPGITVPVSKSELIEALLQSHEQAKKNRLLGNFSGFQRASNMLLANGQWTAATNIELTRDNILCGERSATVAAWNEALNKTPLSALEDPVQKEQVIAGLKVKLLAMSEGASPIRKSAAPCSECLSWLETQKYFSPDTLTAALVEDENTGGLTIEVKSVQEMLPHLNKQTPSLTDKSVKTLPVDFSAKALSALGQNRFAASALTDLMQSARDAYEANCTATLSGKNTGAAVRLTTGKTYTGARFDWTRRWFEGAELSAAARGIQAHEKALAQGKPVRVQAVAYYGEAIAPDTKSLGILVQQGGPDTLVVVIESDRIQVRTIADYMTSLYVSNPNPTSK